MKILIVVLCLMLGFSGPAIASIQVAHPEFSTKIMLAEGDEAAPVDILDVSRSISKTSVGDDN